MADIIPFGRDRHDEVQQLLPWYVTDRLELSDRRKVSAHLSTCGECRADLEAEQALAAMVKASPASAHHGWSALRERLEQRPALSREPREGVRGRAPRTIAVAGALMAACVALPMAPIGFDHLRSGHEARYHTLSSAPSNPPGNVLVMFKGAGQAASPAVLIRSAGGTLVRGPTETGAYLIEIPAAQRRAALRMLRARPEILLAEPVDATAR